MNVPYISQWKLMKQVVVPFSKCSQCKWCSWSLLVKCQPFSWWQDVRQPLKSHRGRIVHLWELFLLSSNRSRSLWLNRKKRPKMAQYDLVGGFFFQNSRPSKFEKDSDTFCKKPYFRCSTIPPTTSWEFWHNTVLPIGNGLFWPLLDLTMLLSFFLSPLCLLFSPLKDFSTSFRRKRQEGGGGGR